MAASVAAALALAACGKKAPAEPAPAPEFSVLELGGKPLTLSGLKGKVVLLDFWATWCLPCEETIPHLKRLSDRHGGRGLEVVGLSVDDEPDDVAPYARSHRMSYRVAIDADKAVMEAYGVRSVPTTILIDRAGRVRRRWLGFGDDVAAELDEAVEQLLSEH